MRKVKLQMQMTINGYVGGPNGENDWMTWNPDDEFLGFINSHFDSSDTMLLGRKLADGFIEHWENTAVNNPDHPFAKKIVEMPKVVFTKTLDESTWNNTVLAKGNLAEEIADLKNQNGKDIAVVGGADFLLDEVEKTDLIFIPAFVGDLKIAVEMNMDFIPWLIKQRERGAEIVSLCVGAFLLAKTGLLDGKQCSTHWRAADEFRRTFPGVEVVTDQIITEKDGIYTSGGATSYYNLLIYLVEKFTNRETAIRTAKVFAIDFERDSQSSFIIFKGQNQHSDEEVKKAQDFIENNLQNKITIDELSSQVALGRRSLERRFKEATNNTVAEYVQRVKIEAAKKRFETSRKSITDVMFDVGYSDTKAFRSVFKKITGMTPIDYRKRYTKEL